MVNIKELWKQRFDEVRKEITTYSKLMFNDHLMIVILFLLVAGAYLYQKALEKMSPTFPASWVMAILLGIVVVWSPIYTMLKEADLVFIWPNAHHMKPFFRKTLVVIGLIQAFLVVVVSFMVLPLYKASKLGTTEQFFGLLFALLVMKAFNLYWSWLFKRVYDVILQKTEFFLRLFIHILIFYIIFETTMMNGLLLWGVIALCLTIGYYLIVVKKHGLKWERLVLEQKMGMMRFYKTANQFTDVQKLTMPVRNRKYLTWTLKRIPFQKEYTYLYMYTRAFLRAGDYFGMYIRLSVLSIIILYFTKQFYLMFFILIATLYLIGYQLIPLYRHYERSVLTQLYPVKEEDKEIAFINFLLILLIIEAVLYATFVWIFTGNWVDAANILFFASMFSFWFVFKYIKKRLH